MGKTHTSKAAAQKRARELVGTMTLREAADTLRREGLADVSHVTVATWTAGAVRTGSGSKPASSPAPPTSKPSGRLVRARPVAPAAPQAPQAPGSQPGDEDLPQELRGLDLAAQDLDVLRELDRGIGAQMGSVARDETRLWIALVRLRMDIRSAMARLRPPPPVDPDADPLSLAARDEALAKIAKALRAAGVA